jgi:sterol desaturase/sphingolipid hydroxylase (fatty acid hydroxylase superfamily)/predicted amino acid dehydrogenase
VAHMVMNALAKWDSFANRTRIIRKNPPASQLERELDYDNALMFSIAAFLAVKLVTPFLDYPVELSRKSIIWCFIGHFFVTEPIYYAFHRWMHIPAIFKKTHFHHHTSIVPEPNSGTSHPILENIAYMANFSFAFLVPAAAGYYSHALIGPYFVLFDILNIMGHSNFEWFPSWWYRTPMKYLLYTTTHHSLHHSRFKCNYVLFCPVWDYLFGTTHPETEATFSRVHTQKPPKLNAAFLCHGFKHNSILHTAMVSPVQATREVKDAWWHPILLPVLIPLAGICTYWGKPFTMQRYTYSGANIITRVVPHLAYDYVNKRHHASINRHLLACIREAARQGASVVGLGALNKAHFLNSGGEDLLPHLRDLKGVALVHGNTLTTAVVWDALRRRLPPRSLVVLTGPTAKIGAALTRLLIRDGHTVQALTSDRARFDALRDSLADLGDKTAFDRLKLLTHISQGHDSKYWVLGKACRIKDVAHINSEAHVFEYAVPRIDTSLTGKFRNYCAIGAMTFDKAKTDLNFCHDVPGTVPACLAATIIHALEGTTEHEVSSVPSDTATMERWLSLAKKHGFTSAELGSLSTIKSIDWKDKDGKRPHQESSSPRSIVLDDGTITFPETPVRLLDDGTITFPETPVRLNSSKLASTGTQPVSKRDSPPIYEWTFSALLSLLPAFAVFTATVAFLDGPLPSVEISTSTIIRSFVF